MYKTYFCVEILVKSSEKLKTACTQRNFKVSRIKYRSCATPKVLKEREYTSVIITHKKRERNKMKGREDRQTSVNKKQVAKAMKNKKIGMATRKDGITAETCKVAEGIVSHICHLHVVNLFIRPAFALA